MTALLKTATPRQFSGLLLFANAMVLLGAYGFEFIGRLAPCQLCYYQRIPYFLAIILSGAAWLRPGQAKPLFALLMLCYLAGSGLGAYHAGVEWKLWAGPASCSAMGGGNLTVEQLMAQILAAPVVRCDEIPWSLFGISLAGYNALISAGLLALSAYAFICGKKGAES